MANRGAELVKLINVLFWLGLAIKVVSDCSLIPGDLLLPYYRYPYYHEFPDFREKWCAYWEWSPYKPFALSAWAYEDSTILKWYGVGFVWFLLRLALALALGVLDEILGVIFIIAGVCDVFFGATVRNIALGVLLGILALIVLIIVAGLLWFIVEGILRAIRRRRPHP